MSTLIDLEIDQGTTETVEFTWLDDSTNLPIDLSNCTAKMQVRPAPGGSPVLLEYNTSNGSITLGGDTGVVSIFISPSDTTSFGVNQPWTKGFYDVFVTNISSSAVTKIAQGYFIIIPSVTVLP